MAGRRLLLVVNPASGRRRSLAWAKKAQDTMSQNNIGSDLVVSEYPGHMTKLIGDVDLDRYTGLGVVGGDGSVRELVIALQQRPESSFPPIGLLAAGTGNSLHQDLGIQDPREGLRRIIADDVRTVDLLRVRLDGHVTYCINIVGWAAAAAIGRRAESIRWMGRARYAIATLIEVFRAKRLKVQLETEGQIQGKHLFLAVGCNTQYAGSNMRLAPMAAINDGLVDLITFGNASRLQMMKLFTDVYSGAHLSHPAVECIRVPKYTIKSEEPSLVNLDGDLTENSCNEIDVEVIPNALQIYA